MSLKARKTAALNLGNKASATGGLMTGERGWGWVAVAAVLRWECEWFRLLIVEWRISSAWGPWWWHRSYGRGFDSETDGDWQQMVSKYTREWIEWNGWPRMRVQWESTTRCIARELYGWVRPIRVAWLKNGGITRHALRIDRFSGRMMENT